MSIEARPLPEALDETAARLLSDSFLDDPAYLAIGPRREDRRWAFLLRVHRGSLRVARRWGGPVHGAFDGERLVAASLCFDEGRWPPPKRSMLSMVSVAWTSPGAARRGIPVTALMERHHPRLPHVYLEILGAHPLMQRRGAGRALLERMIDDADQRGLPCYLETTKLENVGYYRGYGFDVDDEAPIGGTATMWFMTRPAR